MSAPLTQLVRPSRFKRPLRLAFSFFTGTALVGGAFAYYVSVPESFDPAQYPNRKKAVILGSGWAAVACMRALDPKLYEVTLVSPRDHFLFTPGLAAVCTGKVSARSIAEPLRALAAYYHANYLQASAIDVSPSTNTVRCRSAISSEEFDLPYHELVFAVGAVNNTFQTPGVGEHAETFRQIDDATNVRRRVLACFEKTQLPNAKQEINFVVVGGGPNGVEFAAELHDYIERDLQPQFKSARPKVIVVELLDHILNSYDDSISDYAEKHFQRHGVNIMTHSRVQAVAADHIEIFKTDAQEQVVVPADLTVWSTGIGLHPLASRLQDKLQPYQNNRRSLLTTDVLLVKGSRNIWAPGDAGTIQQQTLRANLLDLFREADANNSGHLSKAELREFVARRLHEHPQLKQLSRQLIARLTEEGKDADRIDLETFARLLEDADRAGRLLPATAQVAVQQGDYVGRQLNLREMGKGMGPFRYRHFASIAYVGNNKAVADFFNNYFVLSGFGAWWLWRSVYLSNQVSWRSRTLLWLDHVKAWAWGRHTSAD